MRLDSFFLKIYVQQGGMLPTQRLVLVVESTVSYKVPKVQEGGTAS